MKKDTIGKGLPAYGDVMEHHLCDSMEEGALISHTKELVFLKSEAPGEEGQAGAFIAPCLEY